METTPRSTLTPPLKSYTTSLKNELSRNKYVARQSRNKIISHKYNFKRGDTRQFGSKVCKTSGHVWLLLRAEATGPASCMLCAVSLQGLSKFTTRPDLWTLPIEYVDGNGHENGQTGKNGTRPLQVELATDVAVHWSRVHGRQPCEKITSKAVASSGGRRVRSVCGNHIVDGCHVDPVIRNGNQENKNKWHDPMGVVRTH